MVRFQTCKRDCYWQWCGPHAGVMVIPASVGRPAVFQVPPFHLCYC